MVEICGGNIGNDVVLIKARTRIKNVDTELAADDIFGAVKEWVRDQHLAICFLLWVQTYHIRQDA
jgi:hypothetical protein